MTEILSGLPIWVSMPVSIAILACAIVMRSDFWRKVQEANALKESESIARHSDLKKSLTDKLTEFGEKIEGLKVDVNGLREDIHRQDITLNLHEKEINEIRHKSDFIANFSIVLSALETHSKSHKIWDGDIKNNGRRKEDGL